MPGFAAQTKDGLVVALRTEMTPLLYERGMAREMIRTIGELRKQAQCKVSDRVRIGYFTEKAEVMEILKRQTSWIEEETLSSFKPQLLSTWIVQGQIELDEHQV